MFTWLTRVAGNGPSSKQKLKSQKRKKRKRSDDEDKTEASSPVTEDAHRETEGTETVADHVESDQRGEQYSITSVSQCRTFYNIE